MYVPGLGDLPVALALVHAWVGKDVGALSAFARVYSFPTRGLVVRRYNGVTHKAGTNLGVSNLFGSRQVYGT